jgi:hypothetical protein
MSKIRLEYISQATLGEPTLLASVEVNIGARAPDKHTMENGLRALLLAATYHPDTVDGIFAPEEPQFTQSELALLRRIVLDKHNHLMGMPTPFNDMMEEVQELLTTLEKIRP